MSQHLEIEFKNMLSKNEYQKLMKFFHIPKEKIFSQENHYFDTPDFLLKEKRAALRIRQKGDEFEMTLKQPVQGGLLETNQRISVEETSLALKENKLPDGSIKELIIKMDIPFEKLEYFGSLTTNRAEIAYKGGVLVFDHSCYLNQEDFELEYEVGHYQHGLEIFNQFLREHGIPVRKTINKIRRFYQQKYQQSKHIREETRR